MTQPSKAGRGRKQVRETFDTYVIQHFQSAGNYALVLERKPLGNFKIGDKVRVRVELLARTRKG